MAEFRVGDEFKSFEELTHAIQALEKVQNINFSVRDSRSIAAAKGRITFVIKPALQYYELKYVCMKGEREYASKSTGARPDQRLLYITSTNAVLML